MELIITAIMNSFTSAATKDLYDMLKRLLFKKDTTGNLPNVLPGIEKKAKGDKTEDEKDLIKALLIEALKKSSIDSNDSELIDVAKKIIKIYMENKPPTRIHIYNYRWGNNNNKKSEPYHLETFQPNDEELFNTRGIFIDTVDSICLKINKYESNFITLEGESGSGKSSLVLAGLVPRLAKEGDWKFIYVKFNEDPYQELAAGLVAIKKGINDPITTNPDDVNQLSLKIKENEKELKNNFQNIKDDNSGTRILLIADQLDSLYTKCTQEVRTHFLTQLKNSLPKENADSIALIATFDSSFFQKDGNNDQDYKNIIGKDVEKMPALQPEILKKLITEPASKKGVEFDEYVVEKIIDDLGDRNNDLVLLGATLANLWNIKTDHDLKLITKRELIDSGGVDKALDSLAKKNYNTLEDTDTKEKAKKLFLRMIHHYDKTSGKIIPRSITVRSDEYAGLIKKLSRIIRTTNNSKPDEIIEIEFFHAKLAENWKDLLNWVDSELNLNSARTLESDVYKWKESPNSRWNFLHSGDQLKKDWKLFQNHTYLFGDPNRIEEFLNKSNTKKHFLYSIYTSIVVITAILVFSWYEDNEIEKLTSMGEKRLFSSIDSDKINGINNFKEDRYSEAESKFVEALKNNKNDPESLIYKNNARINALKQNNLEIKPILIATSVPKGGNKAVALEILRGVAHAHNDIMKDFESKCIDEKKLYKVGCEGGIKGRPLQLMIIDDSNNPDTAVKIAKYLVKKQKEVYALVGHNASEVSSKAAIEYQKGKLVMVTPNSFALNFKELGEKDGEHAKENYIFAVTYSHEILIKKIIDEMNRQLPGEKLRVLLCYDANAFDQNVIVGSFENFAKNNKGKIELIGVKKEAKDISCDFSKADLNLAEILEEAKNKDGINVIFVASHVNRIGDSIAVLKNIKRDKSLENIKIFSSPTLYTNQTLELGGKNVANLTMAVSWFPESSLKVVEEQFEKEAIKLWAEDGINICYEDDINKEICINHLDILDEIGITWRAAMAYDATRILKEGLSDSGEISRESLQKSLSSPKFSFAGVTGLVKFFSSCSTEEINSKDVECFPGKRMVTDRNPDPAIIIKVNEVTERITHYRFDRDQ